ncbi:Hypothetical protein RG540_CH06680 [Neorhizobium galegae bv. orientalis str. HAMBI 540]|uniref:Uncharacterized protein n=1 Tax=Neorhizobium galegae bv. orientalis str. HAMBI 540 TaxID=1028800 RepID=A0A068SL18_NEOGA|nr:Hypothetical protein RG540_CH06680 [Neorhizobium galegae bv. orientalis str. HAMBI 540]
MAIALCSASNHHNVSPAQPIFSNCAHLACARLSLPGHFFGSYL